MQQGGLELVLELFVLLIVFLQFTQLDLIDFVLVATQLFHHYSLFLFGFSLIFLYFLLFLTHFHLLESHSLAFRFLHVLPLSFLFASLFHQLRALLLKLKLPDDAHLVLVVFALLIHFQVLLGLGLLGLVKLKLFKELGFGFSHFLLDEGDSLVFELFFVAFPVTEEGFGFLLEPAFVFKVAI